MGVYAHVAFRRPVVVTRPTCWPWYTLFKLVHLSESATSACAMSETRLAFKAGRAFRRGASNFVDPEPTKGAILLQNGEDGLLHFVWKNRTTNVVDEVRYSNKLPHKCSI